MESSWRIFLLWQSSCRVVSSSLHGRVATCQKKMTKHNTWSSWRSSYSSAIQVMNWLRSPSMSLDHHLHPVLGVVNARKFSWNHKQLWFCRSTSSSHEMPHEPRIKRQGSWVTLQLVYHDLESESLTFFPTPWDTSLVFDGLRMPWFQQGETALQMDRFQEKKKTKSAWRQPLPKRFANQVLSKTAKQLQKFTENNRAVIGNMAILKVQICSKDAFSMKMAMIRLKTPRQTSMNMHT